MSHPRPWSEHEAARVSRCSQQRGVGVAVAAARPEWTSVAPEVAFVMSRTIAPSASLARRILIGTALLLTLGMTEAGVPVLLELVAAGCKVKATGFGRTKVDIPKTLERIARQDPAALVFGTDLPSTRADRPFLTSDIDLIERVLGPALSRRTFWDNALALYRVTTT